MRISIILFFTLILFDQSFGQQKTENLIIVTLDGMRWHEIFKGIDTSLVKNKNFTKNSVDLLRKYWSDDLDQRRRKLFPFIWNTISENGQLYGNRLYQNKIDNANPYWFSYPGYNEIFTGYPDSSVNSNDKIWNENENVLEYINKQKGFNGKVAAFSTWDVFPYILNVRRSGIYVNADVDSMKFSSPELKLLNDMQFLTPRPIGVRPDIITYMAAREYLKEFHPRVLYVAFDETDDFAHGGEYDQYIESAYSEDRMIGDLWKTIQSISLYKDKTTLLITSDHGRGDINKENWRHHGNKIEDAHEIWLAVIGPDTEPLGELKYESQMYQKQIASTLASLLGMKFLANHPVAEPIKTILKK